MYQMFQGNPLWHLTIERLDLALCHDWQVFQTIKNEIVGPEYEAVEMYPAHSRLMDEANKYHLWILAPNDNEKLPPRFKIGCKRHGAVGASGKADTMLVAERVVVDHIEETREMVDRSSMDFRVFPETLRGEVEKEFPGAEGGIRQYAAKHPEIEFQLFDEWLDTAKLDLEKARPASNLPIVLAKRA
jgi:hypothetical protein